jgi:hypothetical protein
MISMAKLFDMRIFKAHLLLFWITIILQEFQVFGFWSLVFINLIGLALSISLDPSVLPSLVRKGIVSYFSNPPNEQQYPQKNKHFFPAIRIEEVKEEESPPLQHVPGNPRPKMRPLMKKIN